LTGDRGGSGVTRGGTTTVVASTMDQSTAPPGAAACAAAVPPTTDFAGSAFLGDARSTQMKRTKQNSSLKLPSPQFLHKFRMNRLYFFKDY
jgi:hypothetical protein